MQICPLKRGRPLHKSFPPFPSQFKSLVPSFLDKPASSVSFFFCFSGYSFQHAWHQPVCSFVPVLDLSVSPYLQLLFISNEASGIPVPTEWHLIIVITALLSLLLLLIVSIRIIDASDALLYSNCDTNNTLVLLLHTTLITGSIKPRRYNTTASQNLK